MQSFPIAEAGRGPLWVLLPVLLVLHALRALRGGAAPERRPLWAADPSGPARRVRRPPTGTGGHGAATQTAHSRHGPARLSGRLVSARQWAEGAGLPHGPGPGRLRPDARGLQRARQPRRPR